MCCLFWICIIFDIEEIKREFTTYFFGLQVVVIYFWYWEYQKMVLGVPKSSTGSTILSKNMGKGKVIYTEHMVDMSTGELISSKSVYVSRSNERFWMFRATENPEWIFKLGGNEMKVLLYMQSYADAENRVWLDTERRVKLCAGLGIKSGMLSRLLLTLARKGFIVKVGVNSYMTNPNYVYRCPVKELRNRMEVYGSLKS